MIKLNKPQMNADKPRMAGRAATLEDENTSDGFKGK